MINQLNLIHNRHFLLEKKSRLMAFFFSVSHVTFNKRCRPSQSFFCECLLSKLRLNPLNNLQCKSKLLDKKKIMCMWLNKHIKWPFGIHGNIIDGESVSLSVFFFCFKLLICLFDTSIPKYNDRKAKRFLHLFYMCFSLFLCLSICWQWK